MTKPCPIMQGHNLRRAYTESKAHQVKGESWDFIVQYGAWHLNPSVAGAFDMQLPASCIISG